jgi:adenosylmethionine-8-amino-7-oxononanoate aminotransferase
MNEHKHPNGQVFYRRMGHDHPLIVKSKGVYLYDSEGSRYMDGSGGALVVNAGHGVESINLAMRKQADEVSYIHGTMFTCKALEEYSLALSKITPLPNAKFYYLTSGSEAVEAAIKFARQVHLESGETNRHLTISRWMSYHGATLGALGVTGKEKMRKPYKPMFNDNPHIQPPYCYRCPYELEYPACELKCAQSLEETILENGPENVSAFIAEPVSGATLGGVVPPDGYWQMIREICDKYGVLLISDEVMTGMGRTGKWFGIEQWNVTPDLITIGKGAASGYFPLSILAVKGEYVDLIAEGTGNFNHGGTFSHHAVGAATGLATLDYIKENNLIEGVNEKGAYLGKALREKIGVLDCVGDIRGMGLMWGIEFVEDKETKAPFEYKRHLSQKITDDAFANGLIVYPGSGSIDGVNGDHLMIGPPFSITEAEIDELVAILESSIKRTV